MLPCRPSGLESALVRRSHLPHAASLGNLVLLADVPICVENLLSRPAPPAGLAKATVELHKAAGAAWGPKNPNALWTDEVTDAASTALRTAKVVASDGKVAPSVGRFGNAQPGQHQAQQKKVAPGAGKKKSTNKKKKR